MTAKQKKARETFKAVVKEAGKLRKKNPSLTQAQAVKQAWAMHYGGSRIAEIGRVKKSATKKSATKKSATKKSATKKSPAIVQVRQKIKRVLKQNNVRMPHGYELAKGSVRNLAGYNLDAMHGTPDEFHKDTKSHNVNIRVVSGLDDHKKRLPDAVAFYQHEININNGALENLKRQLQKAIPKEKPYIRSIIKDVNALKKYHIGQRDRAIQLMKKLK